MRHLLGTLLNFSRLPSVANNMWWYYVMVLALTAGGGLSTAYSDEAPANVAGTSATDTATQSSWSVSPGMLVGSEWATATACGFNRWMQQIDGTSRPVCQS